MDLCQKKGSAQSMIVGDTLKKTEKKIDGTCFGSRVSMIILEKGLVSAMSTHGFSSCCDLLYEQTQGLKKVGETIGTDIVSYFRACVFAR
jgi:hypothetical protein